MIIVNIACSDLGSSEIVTKINADVMTGCAMGSFEYGNEVHNVCHYFESY